MVGVDMMPNTPVACDNKKCRKIASHFVGGNFGEFGKLMIASCDLHVDDSRKLMRKTMVWGRFPLDISVEDVSLF
jgi:hypothetical protein